MKILRVIARLNVGGPARHVLILEDRLRARGYETLLVYGHVGPGEASMEAHVAQLGIPAEQLRGLGRRIGLVQDLRSFADLLRIVFREAPDVIHTHTSKAGFLGRAAASFYNLLRPRSRRALVVHTFHGHVLAGYFGRTGSALARQAERMLSRRTDVIVAISPRQRDELVERFRIAPPEKVRVIPLGLELDAFFELSPPPDRQPVTFGFVGRLVPIKALETMLTAFAQAASAGRPMRLRLIGDGPQRPALQARAQELGIADRVEFAGWTADLPAAYANLDAVVLTSRNEGTPVALIEGMAAARPVIATDVGGVRDLVPDGAGVIVPPGDVEAIARAMRELASEPGARARLGLRGREHVRGRYAADRLVGDIAGLYVDALAARRTGASEARAF